MGAQCRQFPTSIFGEPLTSPFCRTVLMPRLWPHRPHARTRESRRPRCPEADQTGDRRVESLAGRGRHIEMKAISLWQPWASLWCSNRKVHETRHWRCRHRGWLLVHAAKRFEKNFQLDDPLRLILDDEFGRHWATDLPAGALIGMVNVIDCLPTQTLFGGTAASGDDRECGDFGSGRFAWKRGEFRLFEQPVPYRGRQGIFNVPDDLIPMVAVARG
jgi:hypothetical protein